MGRNICRRQKAFISLDFFIFFSAFITGKIYKGGIAMLSFFNRMKSKKGFTLIEMIVVLAIIGVLIAMVLPALTSSNKDKIGAGLAKDFFYRVQDVMCDVKISDKDAFSGSTFSGDSEVVFYADIDVQGTVTETGILRNTNNTNPILKLTAPYVRSNTSVYDEAFLKAFNKFSDSAEKYVTQQNEMIGTLYAVVDKNFAVQAAYWCDMSGAEMTSATTTELTLEDDNILFSGYYCCAYPTQLSIAGKEMYKYT
ncbi:MAG: competence type IV pilus major pilin ComGC [Ruminiclostridium sp.]